MAEEIVAAKFKIGDKVKLKSGGEKMTVAGLRKEVNVQTSEIDLFYGFVFCQWFEGGKMKTDRFHQDVLVLIE